MKLLKSEEVSSSSTAFYRAALLFISTPQAANKKICGCVIENITKVNCQLPQSDLSWDDFKEINFESVTEPFQFSIRTTIVPKNVSKDKFNVVAVLEQDSCKFNRIRSKETGLLPEFNYTITYSDGKLTLCVAEDAASFETYEKSATWLSDILFDKFQKWMKQEETHKSSVKSLQLVDVEEYNQLYATLKAKYGSDLMKLWTECTDPQKYIYEDIGIATYLIILWRNEREEKQLTHLQSFVDIGCGNGLLVFILTSEGHPGSGIDLRSRKIWSQYPDSVKLKEETITPSTTSLFPDIDWVIGNHSDELSVWIPVISARSSYHSRFFLLPCCAFEFNGEKFRRRTTLLSVYEGFIEYLKEISTVCGFTYQSDRLKIPSTKRIAIVGQSRAYHESEFAAYSVKIQEFIGDSKEETTWCADYKPRETVEKINNCSTVDKSVEATIIELVFCELMKKKRYVDAFPGWNIGGSLSLGDAAKLVPEDLRKKLKSECGGLQTLLKNNHSIFEVKQGAVQVRLPVSLGEKLKQQKKTDKTFVYQKKSCWFLSHHPDGCPFSETSCSYSHKKDGN